MEGVEFALFDDPHLQQALCATVDLVLVEWHGKIGYSERKRRTSFINALPGCKTVHVRDDDESALHDGRPWPTGSVCDAASAPRAPKTRAGNCGTTVAGKNSNVSGSWTLDSEGELVTLGDCAERCLRRTPRCNFVSFSPSAPEGNDECSWYESCDLSELVRSQYHVARYRTLAMEDYVESGVPAAIAAK